MRGVRAPAGALARYTAASERAAAQIIGVYSTSFGAATALLGRRHRAHVRNIYALVRVADELVDGVADEARLPSARQHESLDALQEETRRTVAEGYSSNPIVHAFAHTARAARFADDLIAPFFSSMRTDLSIVAEGHRPAGFDPTDHDHYVHGSAEVIGLMCLRVFLRDETVTPADRELLENGARSLGAAFQNINFLRDLADDTDRLGRSYLSESGRLTRSQKDAWVARITEQLDAAAMTLPLLPRDARAAVTAAHGLFRELSGRLADADLAALYSRRIRVPATMKAIILARSCWGWRT